MFYFMYVVLLEPEAQPDLCSVTSTEPSENFCGLLRIRSASLLVKKRGKNAYVQAKHSVVFSTLEELLR